MQTLDLHQGPARLEGAVHTEADADGIQPYRYDFSRRRLFEEGIRNRASTCAGIRLSLVSDTDALEIDASLSAPPELPDAAPQWTFDLLVDGKLHERKTQNADQRTVRFDHLPVGEHRLELYLPQSHSCKLHALRIDDRADAKPLQLDRPRWVVYGSSITHCGAAAGPSETWPAIVANRLNLDLTCLGYGGNCQLEPMVARMIRDLPADYISLCLGINTHGGSYSERTFRAAAIGLIETIREKHPDTPIACVSPIYSPPREDGPGNTGMTLKLLRTWVADAVNAIRETDGDANLHYVDGLALYGEPYLRHMPDQLHPDAEGYRVLAERYLEVVMPVFGFPAPAAAPA